MNFKSIPFDIAKIPMSFCLLIFVMIFKKKLCMKLKAFFPETRHENAFLLMCSSVFSGILKITRKRAQ